MFLLITFVFHGYFQPFGLYFGVFLDCSARVSLQSFLKNAESLFHFIYLKNVSDAGVVVTLARSLVE